MKREEAISVLEMFEFKQCDLGRMKHTKYTENDVWKAMLMAIEALQAQPTHGRLIDADALRTEFERDKSGHCATWEFCDKPEDVQFVIDNAPTVQADRPHGEWIYHVDDLFPAESTQECSNCNKHQPMNINDDDFCPACGADMRKDNE